MEPITTAIAALNLGPEQISVLNDIEQGPKGRFVFVTGKAGTGKSTLLREFVAGTRWNTAVVAPTGLAAIQVGGQTIHSFFLFPFGPLTNDGDSVPLFKRGHPRRRLIEKLDCLVIDEISMVRADVLDAIDFSLRINTESNQPFGGKTVVAFGDIRQLEPVVQAGADSEMLSDRFASPFFFDAHVLKETGIDSWRLETVYRQKDEEFLWALEQLRTGRVDNLDFFNQRVGESLPGANVVTLTATNARADSINLRHLSQLREPPRVYKASKSGNFERDFPTDPILTLRPGAQVMFVKNGKEWSNGTVGRVAEVLEDKVTVVLESGTVLSVGPEKWEKTRYTWDSSSSRIGKEVVGEFVQIPLRLAWAVTIHKSQGLTLDSVIVDLDRPAFAHGQVYVALSRCRTLEGMSLVRPIRPQDIVVHPRVDEFEASAKLF